MWRTICVCCLCALATAPLLAAPPARLAADVPFAFEVQGRVMPAGHYELHPVGHAGVVSITHENGQKVLALLRRDGVDRQRPELVFERRGERTKLTGIRTRPVETVVKPEFR
jgi:hypothetical protein